MEQVLLDVTVPGDTICKMVEGRNQRPFFLFVCLFLWYHSARGMFHVKQEIVMADPKAGVSLSDVERKLVVDALATREASVLRAAKAATNQVIAEELRKEYNAIVVLRQRLSTS